MTALPPPVTMRGARPADGTSARTPRRRWDGVDRGGRVLHRARRPDGGRGAGAPGVAGIAVSAVAGGRRGRAPRAARRCARWTSGIVGPRDGIEAAAEIRARLGVNCIFVTANTDPATLAARAIGRTARRSAQAAHASGPASTAIENQMGVMPALSGFSTISASSAPAFTATASPTSLPISARASGAT